MRFSIRNRAIGLALERVVLDEQKCFICKEPMYKVIRIRGGNRKQTIDDLGTVCEEHYKYYVDNYDLIRTKQRVKRKPKSTIRMCAECGKNPVNKDYSNRWCASQCFQLFVNRKRLSTFRTLQSKRKEHN